MTIKISKNFVLRFTLIAFVILATILVADDRIVQNVPALHPDIIAFFQVITELGISTWYLISFAIITLLSFMVWKIKRNQLAKMIAVRVSFLFATMASSGIVVNILKPLFARARPREWLRHNVDGFFYWSEIGKGHLSNYNSFPSGHAATVFALALSLSVLLPPRYRYLSFVFFTAASLIAVSRIITSSHHLSDLIAGAFVAVLCCNAWREFYGKKFSEFPKL